MIISLPHFQQWLKAAGRSKRTIELRAYYVRRAGRAINKPLAAVTAGDLIGWLGDQDWAPDTRKSCLASLRVFFRWAADFDLIEADPALKLPSVTVPRGEPRPAPTALLNQALEAATDRDWLLIGLAAYAGLRRTEIATLTWESVEWNGLRIRGKGGRTRFIPLLPLLRERLTAERELRDQGKRGTGWRYRFDPGSPYVFPGSNGAAHISADRVTKIITAAMGSYSPHTLRHRFASSAYAVERDMRAVQDLMGHASVETTQIYTLVPRDAKRKAVAGTVTWDDDEWQDAA